MTLEYLDKIDTPIDLLKRINFGNVALYCLVERDWELLQTLESAETEFLVTGDLESAIANFQRIYDALPAEERVAKENAKILLETAKKCQ